MTNRGLILRIKDGLYNVIPYEKNSKEYFPNWHLAADAIVKPMKYYIGFYSALDIHGLLTQPSLVEQIVLNKQAPKKYRIVKEVKFEFITFNKNKFFGFEKTWIDDFNKVFCSDIEKTIIDCLYKPNYANGVSEIAKAIFRAKQKIKPEKFLSYLEKFDMQVVYKRFGYLLHNMGLLKTFSKEINFKLTDSYTYLDPSLPKEGKHYSDWKIVDNVGIESDFKINRNLEHDKTR